VSKKPAAKKRMPAKPAKKAVVKKKAAKKSPLPIVTPPPSFPVTDQGTQTKLFEEKVPDIQQPAPITETLPDMDQKAQQKAAEKNYNNHNIKLSKTKKGGPKPAGKKPLW